MNIIIGCEESQIITEAFRSKGHNAFSCDLMQTSGNHPEWHIKDNLLNVIRDHHWDMMICFPPCTFLSFAGNGYFNISKYGDDALERWGKRIEAAEFFLKLYNSNISKIAIENPFGFMNSTLPASQIIHPYYMGDPHQKRTCLWLKNLPLLQHSEGDLFSEKTHVKPKPIYISKNGKPLYFAEAHSGGGGKIIYFKIKNIPWNCQSNG